MRRKVVIIGGGITGLAAAYFLEQANDLDIVLIEGSEPLGGKIRTLREDGFVVEAGPDSFITVKPWGIELVRKTGLDKQLISAKSSMYYVLIDGTLRRIPEGFISMVPTQVFEFFKSDLFSPKGKLRLGLEPLIPAKRDREDESIEHFITRRMGREVSERFAEPLFCGIYASTADRLSLLATFPQFREMELKYGSVTKGVLRQLKDRREHIGSMFASLKDGMQSMVEGIVSQLSRTQILKNQTVKTLSRQDSLYPYKVQLENGDDVETHFVILTVPAYAAAQIIKDLDKETSRILKSIRYVSTAVVTLAFKKNDVGHTMNGTGFVIPRTEKKRMTACTWSSSKWEGRAPNSFTLMRCFFGRLGDEDILKLDDEALINAAHQELQEVMHLKSKAAKHWVCRWDKALPQYFVGHLDKLDALERSLKKWPGVFLAGAAYRGVGLPDCIKQAKDVVDQLLQKL